MSQGASNEDTPVTTDLAEGNIEAPAVDLNRPVSASSDGSLSSVSSGSGSGSAFQKRSRSRKTWRQSLQEQEDELDLHSVDDWKAKCKSLQSEVRELEANLLTVNTENTRLQNAQVEYMQTKSRTEEEVQSLRADCDTLRTKMDIVDKENETLKEQCRDLDVNILKMQNDLLNAQTEAGKAGRELEFARRNSGDHLEYEKREEQLLGTVAALKKELNHLRNDVASLTDKLEEKEKVIVELEQRLTECSNNGKGNTTEDENGQSTFGSHLEKWIFKVERMSKTLSLGETPVEFTVQGSPVEDKMSILDDLVRQLEGRVEEEAQYAKQLSIFTKESALKIATALDKNVSFDDVTEVEEGLKMAVDIIEHACEEIKGHKDKGAGDDSVMEEQSQRTDKLQLLLDKWIQGVHEIRTECSSRCYLTTMNYRYDFRCNIDQKIEYFAGTMYDLPQTVKNSFDRVEDDNHEQMARMRKNMEKQREELDNIKAMISDLVGQVGSFAEKNDVISSIKGIQIAFEQLSQGKKELDNQVVQLKSQIQSGQGGGEVIAETGIDIIGGEFVKPYQELIDILRHVQSLVEKKENILEKLNEFKVDFVANGLSSDDEDIPPEMKAMHKDLQDLNKDISMNESKSMHLLKALEAIHRESEDKFKAAVKRLESQMSEKDGNIITLQAKIKEMQSEWETQKESLETQVSSLNIEVDKYKNEGDRLQEMCTTEVVNVNNSELIEKDVIIQKQNHDLACLRDELHQDAQCQLEMKTQIEMIQNQLREAEAKRDEYKESHTAESLQLETGYKNKFSDLENQMTILSKEKDNLERSYTTEITTLKHQIESQNTEIETLQKHLKEAERKIHELNEANEVSKSLGQETAEYKNKLIDMENQMTALGKDKEDMLKSHNMEITTLKHQIESQNTEIETLQKHFKEAETKIHELNEANEVSKSLDQETAEYKNKLLCMENQMTALGKDKEDMLKSHNMEISSLRQQMEEASALLKSEREEFVKLSNIHETEVSRNRAEESAVALSVVEYEEEIKRLKTQLEDTVSKDVYLQDKDSLQKKIDEMGIHVQTAREDNSERERLEKAIEDKDQELATVIESLKATHLSEVDLLKSEITNLTSQLETAGENPEVVQELRDKLESLESENVQLKAERNEIQVSLKTEHSSTIAEYEAREVSFAEQCLNLRTEVEQVNQTLFERNKEIALYSEQVKQHAVTIVAIEERLNQVIEKNKQYREEIERKNEEIRVLKISLEDSGRQKVEPVTLETPRQVGGPPPSKLVIQQQQQQTSSNQGLVRLRRENANLKNQNDQAQKVIAALRRDISGLAARLGDVAGEVDEAKKKEIDENRLRLSDADRELATHKAKVKDLFTVIDEKLAETRRLNAEVKKLKEALLKLKTVVSERDHQVTLLQDKLDKAKVEVQDIKTKHEEEGRITKELATIGATCRGERHTEVIPNQRAALAELRAQIRSLEVWPRPAPTHEEALQQVMLLKKELAEIRARESLSSTIPAAISTNTINVTKSLDTSFDKSAQIVAMETLELSENSYIALVKTLTGALDMGDLEGTRQIAHIPHDEQIKLFQERQQACAIMANRIRLLRERLSRKEELLTGYEDDLAKLHRLEELSSLNEQKVNDLTNEVRQRTEESECLRHTLERTRAHNEPNRRYVTAVHDKNGSEKQISVHNKYCSAVMTESLNKSNQNKTREASELMKKKNYEIRVLKAELLHKEKQLDGFRKNYIPVNERQKTPCPPSGRPSSAKMRRPRPASAKRPSSAKVQFTNRSVERSPSPPKSTNTPRSVVDDKYEVISSTQEIRRSLEVDKDEGQTEKTVEATEEEETTST